MPLKYLSNFWRSLEISLINCKVELKFKLTKDCVLSPNSNDNDNDNANNIIFTIQVTKLYVLVVTLSARDNQKFLKHRSKGFERSVYWNKYETKNENKKTANVYRPFLKLNLVGVNRLLILVYSNQDNNSKRYKAKRYYLPKKIIDNYNVIINGTNFHDQAIDSGIKQYEETRKLAIGQSEDYTTGCLLAYHYIKNHCRLIAVDLSRQKELDVDPKAIQ